jgi:hypothetical protein
MRTWREWKREGPPVSANKMNGRSDPDPRISRVMVVD